jgi:hypothetical protein
MAARRGGLVRGLGILLVCGACACSSKDKAPAKATSPTEPRDAGSGTEAYDGDLPRPREDAGEPQVEPGMPDDGLTGTCAIDSNKIYSVAKRDQPFLSTPLAVDALHSRFALPYVASGDCLDAVHWSSMSGAASGGEPKDAIAMDDCALVKETAATAVGDGWLVGTIDNRQAPYDVWVGPYDADNNQVGSATRLSQSSHVENALALATLRSGDKVMLAYADEDMYDGQALYVRPLDGTGQPLSAAMTIEHSKDLYYTGLGIKPLGDGVGLTYWRYSLDYKTSDLVFVALDATGKPLRDAWVLASSAGPSGSIDMISDSEGGGIVYSRAESQTGRQVWFQQIDETGQAALQRTGTTRAPALRIVNAPNRGIDVSLTKLRASFIITYRELPQDASGKPMLRLYFLDRYGAIVGSSDVSYTSAAGRTATQAANDGRVVVSWSQVNEDGTSELKVVRLPCLGG